MAELNKRSEGIPVLSMLEGSGDHYFSSGNSADYFYHYNLIGNVMFLTDSNGNKVAEYVQEGFGNVLASSGSAPNNYHLTTKERDPNSGLYYFYARWYDPQVGRFITQDRLWRCTNLYQFVKNNPLAYIDPEGMTVLLPSPDLRWPGPPPPGWPRGWEPGWWLKPPRCPAYRLWICVWCIFNWDKPQDSLKFCNWWDCCKFYSCEYDYHRAPRPGDPRVWPFLIKTF